MQKSAPFLAVTWREPELVAPATPTPRGLKPLSVIDSQEGLRVFVTTIQIYERGVLGNDPRDPVRVIREALAEALVFYYPLAGRLREGPGRELVVDCTGEGAVFVEADAHFTVEDLRRDGGGFLHPPFPCGLLLRDVHDSLSSDFLTSAIVLIQVTRFKCGGFSFTTRINHAVIDGVGICQFTDAVAELARRSSRPSVEPVWSRELLFARDPPCVTCKHREYDQLVGTDFPIQYSKDRLIERSFFFGLAELSAIRSLLPPTHSKHCSNFDLLAAFIWRCRTFALRLDPCEEIRYFCVVNVRRKLNPPLPDGYYGNAILSPAAVATAGELTNNGLDYAMELIAYAKAKVTEEYVRSAIDLLVTRDRPLFTVSGSWGASDVSKIGFDKVDFGWGRPTYGGLATAMVGIDQGTGFLGKGKNEEGESGMLLLICLPETAMKRFAEEVKSVAKTSTQISRL